MSAQKLVVFELNEVPFRVFDYFIDKHPDSNFARMFQRSDVFETHVEDEGHLSPWVTWPSVHRGVNNAKHGIQDFGQDLTEVDGEYPPIWEILAKGGVSVGMFGPLHSYPVPKSLDHYKFYIPDTFAAGPECFPEQLSAFQEFNLAMVDASGRNVSKALMLDKAMPFLAAAPGLGLRAKTVLSLGRQLAAERLNPYMICRRRTSQAEIAFDFFLRQLKRNTPDISWFFSNHVASTMHRYWPGTFPGDYPDVIWAEGYEQRFSGEIDYTMGVADRFAGELMAFANNTPGTSIIVMGSMGQEAVPDRLQVNCQIMCTDLTKFMTTMGVEKDQWERRRAMAPSYSVVVSDAAKSNFLSRMSKLRIANANVDFHEHGGAIKFDLGQANLPDDISVGDGEHMYELADLGLRNVEITDKSSAFAYHIPQGVFTHYNPSKRNGFATQRRSISTLEIAPAFIRNFGLEPAGYMQGGLKLS